jgi:hypothetical protein
MLSSASFRVKARRLIVISFPRSIDDNCAPLQFRFRAPPVLAQCRITLAALLGPARALPSTLFFVF